MALAAAPDFSVSGRRGGAGQCRGGPRRRGGPIWGLGRSGSHRGKSMTVAADWRCASEVMVRTSGRGARRFGWGGSWGRPGAHGRRTEARLG
jgi:hypothetical protein